MDGDRVDEGFGAVADTYFLAMEFVDGMDLLRLLQDTTRDKKRLPYGLAAYVVSRDSVAVPVTRLQPRPQSLTPARVRRAKVARPRTTTTVTRTATAPTTTADDHGGSRGSGGGGSGNSGHGGGGDD